MKCLRTYTKFIPSTLPENKHGTPKWRFGSDEVSFSIRGNFQVPAVSIGVYIYERPWLRHPWDSENLPENTEPQELWLGCIGLLYGLWGPSETYLFQAIDRGPITHSMYNDQLGAHFVYFGSSFIVVPLFFAEISSPFRWPETRTETTTTGITSSAMTF